jgi:serine protease Do
MSGFVIKWNICTLIMCFYLAIGTSANAASLGKVFKQVSETVVLLSVSGHKASTKEPGRIVGANSIGSGIVISADGLILSAAHVVQTADDVWATFHDGSGVKATVLGTNISADLALLKLTSPPKNLKYAKLGDSDMAQIGDQIFIVGMPYGLSHTLTAGHLSSKRNPPTHSLSLPIQWLQTDASINQGNSGGPMFNMKGEVIGIVSHMLSKSGGSVGLGFAVSINTAKTLMLNQNTFWGGIEYLPVGGDLAMMLNVPQKSGLLVTMVAHNSPAEAMKLQAGRLPVRIGDNELMLGGDIILAVQGITVEDDEASLHQIREAVINRKPDQELKVKILRAGEIMELSYSANSIQ